MKKHKALLILITSLSLVSIAYGKCYPGLDCPEDLPDANNTPAPPTPPKPEPEQTQQPEPSVNVEPEPEPESEPASKYKKYKPQARQTKASVNTQTSFDYETVAIQGGCFLMGSSSNEVERGNDEKQHKVCIDSFQIGKYEVTQAEWQSIMGDNPSSIKNNNFPVDNVSYQDIQQFIQKLNQQTGETYRLPTEAEWEYAARAGSSTPFYTGDCIDNQQANHDSSISYNNCPTGHSKGGIVAVGSYSPNAWGLYDMAGNAYEWTCSEYDEHYTGNEQKCSNSTDPSTQRVVRGGAWNSKSSGLRSAYRDYDPSNLSDFLGFRLLK
ncbi:Serine/threonine-protein kinase Pkn1 [Methylococcales bacterium]|nr:Serine/threonine-protein kinase Pkn1 [Methylococcales bacterium]